MPKDRRSSSLDRSRASPYSRSYTNRDKKRPKSPSLPIGNEIEWEETKCPICMEHPHNAVLLRCSSREKGCRPYMCDTSARHSNCLDQFRKSTTTPENSQQAKPKLVCPLCRGEINGWIVVDPARKFMNNKPRSCSSSTCDFSGNYSQLRTHARSQHPYVRPTDVDPEQELEWRILEEDLEQQDMFNMQFEFDDNINDNDMNMDLASPIWDYDLDFMQFLTTFESEFDSVFPEFDWGSDDNHNLFLDDWENMFTFSSSHESEIMESENNNNNSNNNNRSRGNNRTRSRTNTNRRDRVTRGRLHDANEHLP